MRLMIMNVQVFSFATNDVLLESKEGILHDDQHTTIKIWLDEARFLNGGPVVGEPYFMRYVNGIENSFYSPEFYYMGLMDHQLVFSTEPMPVAEFELVMG